MGPTLITEFSVAALRERMPTEAARGLAALGQGTHLQFGPCHQDRGDGAVALPLVDGQQPAFGEIEGHAGELRDQSALLVLG